ncbi:MAG: DNA repair protein RecN [Actinomycetota bacterium]|nr:DNA repair protein RecN [Nocardioidaceae bacterium]MDQ3480627.1 DNA repair protein RecN [Actinomycetota bacterium]
MLEELSISSLGVIDDATLELGPGLTVVTGETGAGKTMVVTALSLLLGARADSGSVRQGAAQARVEGRVRLVPEADVAQQAAEVGAEQDGESLLLVRTLTAEGRSRARAGGAAVPATVLARWAADLVVVHGQSDQQLLLSPARQRRCLDAYGGARLDKARTRYSATFDRLRAVSADLDDVVTRARERARELDLLKLGLAEIERTDPQPGEDVELVAEESRLAHADGLRRAADEARLFLSGDEASLGDSDALSLVALARKSLDAERDHDGRLDSLAADLEAASYALVDAAADIASYATGLETDPARLGWVQDRRGDLSALQRKYGDTIGDVLNWAAVAAKRVEELSDDDVKIEHLRDEQQRLQGQLVEHGAALSEQRAMAARTLETSVTAELCGLAMPHASFMVGQTALDIPSRDGLDEIGFLLCPHRGADPRPLQRGASGGELSRVMLAIEVCLAGSQPVPTMVFDEVDVGVGGKAAVEVGRRLARLARSVQVIVVTHLPQVAAFADVHYIVSKSSDGSVTTSGVAALDEAGRRRELSRMLAGLEGSDAALAHADELVALAYEERTA